MKRILQKETKGTKRSGRIKVVCECGSVRVEYRVRGEVRRKCPRCRGEYQRGLWRRQHGSAGRVTGERATGNIAELRDYYVRGLLSRGTRVPWRAWPEWVVRVKRAELMMKRGEWAGMGAGIANSK